jgi:hypothetical protein
MQRRVAAALGRGRQTEQDCPKNLIALHKEELRKAQQQHHPDRRLVGGSLEILDGAPLATTLWIPGLTNATIDGPTGARLWRRLTTPTNAVSFAARNSTSAFQ